MRRPIPLRRASTRSLPSARGSHVERGHRQCDGVSDSSHDFTNYFPPNRTGKSGVQKSSARHPSITASRTATGTGGLRLQIYNPRPLQGRAGEVAGLAAARDGQKSRGGTGASMRTESIPIEASLDPPPPARKVQSATLN